MTRDDVDVQEAVLATARALRTGPGALSVTRDGVRICSVSWGSDDRGVDFALASAAKPMTALVVSCLIDEGRLAWDAPLKDVLPDLTLWDATSTTAVSMRDVLCHRTGLPRHDGVAFGAGDLSRAGLVALLPHLEATAPVGVRFQYNNLMYALAGHVCESLTGTPWSDLLRRYVLHPLGMSVTSVDEDLLAPAGGVRTTADDLALWMAANLQGAGVLGVRARDLHRTELEVEPHGLLPQATTGYGRGWFTGEYRGRRLVHHGGLQPDASSLVALLPEHRLGVAVLLSGAGPGVCEALAYDTLDHLLGLAPMTWSNQVPTPPAPPPAPLLAELRDPTWDGHYVHAAYGRVRVQAPGLTWRQLTLTLARTASGEPVAVGPDGAARPVTLGQDELGLPLEPAVSAITFRKLTGAESAAS